MDAGALILAWPPTRSARRCDAIRDPPLSWRSCSSRAGGQEMRQIVDKGGPALLVIVAIRRMTVSLLNDNQQRLIAALKKLDRQQRFIFINARKSKLASHDQLFRTNHLEISARFPPQLSGRSLPSDPIIAAHAWVRRHLNNLPFVAEMEPLGQLIRVDPGAEHRVSRSIKQALDSQSMCRGFHCLVPRVRFRRFSKRSSRA